MYFNISFTKKQLLNIIISRKYKKVNKPMPQIKPYDRKSAVVYAQTWALSRNPRFYDFTNIGGDCTNFISQCLYAGSNVMNFKKPLGWFYISASNRSASWTGVNYLYNFLLKNNEKGVFAEEVELSEIELGDIIQLGKTNIGFYHSLLVTETGAVPSIDNILICTHTLDSLNRPLNTYQYDYLRCLHILGVYI